MEPASILMDTSQVHGAVTETRSIVMFTSDIFICFDGIL